VLLAQLEEIERLTEDRRATWKRYHAGFASLEAAGLVRRPIVPAHCVHNGHLYYLLVRDQIARDLLIQSLRADGILAPFHYVPLHSSLAGRRYARACGDMHVTNDTSARLIRLPLYAGIAPSVADRVIERVGAHLHA
jgi:dTDP-4-amino-4,6-dideoxygalactose transaminase